MTAAREGEKLMSTSITEYPANPVPRAFSWTGIFAGTFLFLAIEATFTVLGLAIFPFASGGMHWGIGIWMVVLSIVAMYFAGRLGARLSGASNRNSGMYAGLITFGMCTFTVIVLTAAAFSSTSVANAGLTHLAQVMSAAGYWTFVMLVLAMISAGIGGSLGAGSGKLRAKAQARTSEKLVA